MTQNDRSRCRREEPQLGTITTRTTFLGIRLGWHPNTWLPEQNELSYVSVPHVPHTSITSVSPPRMCHSFAAESRVSLVDAYNILDRSTAERARPPLVPHVVRAAQAGAPMAAAVEDRVSWVFVAQ